MSSDVFVVTFNTGNTRLNMQPWNIKKTTQLEDFNQHPKIVLTDSRGKTITHQIDKLEKEGFQLMRDYAQELAAFNQSDSPAALKLTSADKQPRAFSRQPIASYQPAPSEQAITNNRVKETATAKVLLLEFLISSLFSYNL